MAPAMRLATSTMRASLKAPSVVYRNTAFTAARYYSSKSQVRLPACRRLQPDIIH
jgi:citrate synthase